MVSDRLFQQFARRLKKPLKRLPAVAAPPHRAVAQISNLPYRRFLICAARLAPARGEVADALPNTIRRYSRLQICATWSAPAAGLLFAVVPLLAPPARAATNDLTSAIQRGLFEEEANQNLGAAITAYQAVASQFDKDRKLAATAIFRLGECYRKQGNTNDAAAQYERILREFSDQPTLVTLSRQNLAGLGAAPAAPAAPVLSDAARQEQKRLMEEEIKLLEKQVESQKRLVQAGGAPWDSTVPTERELLKLKRQLAALEAGQPIPLAAAETGAPAVSSEADELRRIQALVKDSPDLINAPQAAGETLLQTAAAQGKLAVVKLLLDNGAAVDGLQQPGLTALHYAAGNGHKAIVDLLLSKGAKPGAQTAAGVTPLHLVARKGYEEVAKALLAAGAPVNARTTTSERRDLPSSALTYILNEGQTPLHPAANAGYAGLVELLLAKGADANALDGSGRTALSYAVEKHSQPVVQALLAAKADPNAGSSNLPLAIAAYNGDLPALKLLLANGADPNLNTNVTGILSGIPGVGYGSGSSVGKATPLAVAVSKQRAEAVAELLRAKADPNGSFPGGAGRVIFGALHNAPTLKGLLEGGADPNLRGQEEKSPLLQAVEIEGGQPGVELLLAYKAEPNVGRPKEGWTPLHEAANHGRKEIAELLLKAGADVNAKDVGGYTPLVLAVASNRREVVELLLASKADPNAKQRSDGDTPLHFAVRDGRRELVELLLANQADPNERNKAGQTPLDMAKSQGQAPQRPGMGMMPPGAYRPGTPPPSLAPGQPEPKPEPMADLLRRHGAVDDLPKLDRIMARRSASGFSESAFTKGAQDWNQFTLLELLAVQYKLLAAVPSHGGGAGYGASALFGDSRLPFPDLTQLHISRPAADLKGWQDQLVDLRPVLQSGDCSKDLRLRWGDVVEVPEADHPLNEGWGGFSKAELANFKKCLTRQVEIVVKGQSTKLTLAPRITGLEEGNEGKTPAPTAVPVAGGVRRVEYQPTIYSSTPFWLQPVMLQSKLVLVSSDLSRVKVTRRDAVTGEKREWVVDCSQGGNRAPDFWLRDGDRIEVPERGYSSGTAQTAAPGAAAAPLEYQWRAGQPREAPAARAPQPAPPPPAIIAPATGLPMRGPSVSPDIVAPPPALSQQGARSARQIPGRTLRVPPSQAPQVARTDHLGIGGVRYSPKADDPDLVNAGYHKDRSARTRQAECWEQRATPDLRGRGGNTAVWTGTDLIVFGGEGQGTSFGDGARYSLAEDTWAMLPSEGAPSSRTGHAAVWTGEEMIVWGGFGGLWGNNTNRDDGARYNPKTDSWKPVTLRHAPAARFDLTAVWTGREMLVWGGYQDAQSRYQGAHSDAHLNSGGRYDPASDTWKPITTKGAPSRRSFNSVVWTGKEMIVWGGSDAKKVLADGGRYNPAKDSWKSISTDGAPSARAGHVAVWTTGEMLVWGGSARDPAAPSDYYVNGARYNPETDTWKPMSAVGAPKGRLLTAAAWTRREMVIWGGVNDAQGNGGRFVGTGGRYNPATDTWTEITLTGAPSPRLTSGVWTGEGLLSFGGYNGMHLNETCYWSPQRTLYPFVKE